jgi:hypothetical protein
MRVFASIPERFGGALALLTLAMLAAGLLHAHISGAGTFIGDSDRLNTFLNVRKLQVENIQQSGYVPAWNDGMFMGFSTAGLHWMLAVLDPIAYAEALFPVQRLFEISGFVAIGLLLSASGAAYLFFRDVSRNRFASVVGATLYICSAFSLGRITQVDNAFAVLIFAPLGLCVLRQVEFGSLGRPFVGMLVIFSGVLWFTFLQDAAYIFLLLGCYALYRTAYLKSLWPAMLYGLAVMLAAIVAFPRLVTIYQDVTLLSRSPQNSLPCACELLRWFDDGIMGRFPQEVGALGNPVNLHEGVQIYTSSLVPLFIVLGAGGVAGWTGRSAAALFYVLLGVVSEPLIGLGSAIALTLALVGSLAVRAWWKSRNGTRAADEKCMVAALHADAPFHVAFLGLSIAVMLWAPAQQVLYFVFLKLDFIHSRISIAAALSICTLVSLFLAERLPRWETPTRYLTSAATWAAALVGAFGILWLVDAAARGSKQAMLNQAFLLQLGPQWAYLLPAEVARVAAAAVAFVGLIGVYAITRSRRARQLATYTLGLTILFQAWGYAEFQLSGPQTWSFPRPFEGNDYFMAPPNTVRPPSPSAAAALRSRLETDQFRSVIMAPPDGFPMYRAPNEHGYTAYLALNWQLRLVDGYPTLPSRLAALPWPTRALSVRSLSFRQDTQLPWRLLSILNVKYAVTVNRALYYDSGSTGEAGPADIEVEQNPLPVVPREFFAQSVQSVPLLAVAASVPTSFPLNSPPSRPIWSVVVDPSRPSAIGSGPVELYARSLSASEIELSWTDDVGPVVAYRIEQMKTGEANFKVAATTDPGAQSFVVGGLEPLSLYQFHVSRCASGTCESVFASLIIATMSSLDSTELKNVVPGDPVRESLAEGFDQPGQFATDGSIRAKYAGDRADITVDASARQRFLVLNELYHPAWKAFANGNELKIYPTNTVMRGIVVPPGATHVEMRFQPFMLSPLALVFLAMGALLASACGWYLWRIESQQTRRLHLQEG